jgi:hypothetical protein
VTPIFDLRQLGARSPGTCQVHRRSTAGPSRVHADSDPARLQPDAPRAGRGALHRGARRQARTLRRTADRQHPLGESAARSRVRSDALRRGRILSVRGPGRSHQGSSRGLADPPAVLWKTGATGGDKRFGGPLVHPGRCPLYVRAQPEAAGLAWTQRDINGPKAAAREVGKPPGHGPFPQVVAGVGFEPT